MEEVLGTEQGCLGTCHKHSACVSEPPDLSLGLMQAIPGPAKHKGASGWT